MLLGFCKLLQAAVSKPNPAQHAHLRHQQCQRQPMQKHGSLLPLGSGCSPTTVCTVWKGLQPSKLAIGFCKLLQAAVSKPNPTQHAHLRHQQCQRQPMQKHGSLLPLGSGCSPTTVCTVWKGLQPSKLAIGFCKLLQAAVSKPNPAQHAHLRHQQCQRQPMQKHGSLLPLGSGCSPTTVCTIWKGLQPSKLANPLHKFS